MGRSASERIQRRRSPATSPTGSEDANNKRGSRTAVVVDLHLPESASPSLRHQFSSRRSTIVLSGGGSLNQKERHRSSLKLANHLQDQLLMTQHDSGRSIKMKESSPTATPVTCLWINVIILNVTYKLQVEIISSSFIFISFLFKRINLIGYN